MFFLYVKYEIIKIFVKRNWVLVEKSGGIFVLIFNLIVKNVVLKIK